MNQGSSKKSPYKTKAIPAYFYQNDRKEGRTQKVKDGAKMAEAGKETREETEPLTKADLALITGKIDNLETELAKKLTDIIKPLAEKNEQLHVNLQSVSKIAEGAMDLSLAHREDIQALQKESEAQAEHMAILNNRQRLFNLKFRGIAERAEENVDLMLYMASWLANALALDERCAPLLTQAFRVGRPNNPARQAPRDIIVTSSDIREKNKVMEIARAKGYRLHKTDRIQVYLDLAPEALDKKKELREILAALREANIRHRWATPIKIQVLHKGKSYYIRNEDEGYGVLQSIGLPTPMSTEKLSAKRKLNLQADSPDKSTKKYRELGQ